MCHILRIMFAVIAGNILKQCAFCWNAGKSFMKSIIILSAAWITIAGRLLK